MDWFKFAQDDWNVYHDESRIAKYVSFKKITPVQYKEITGDDYMG